MSMQTIKSSFSNIFHYNIFGINKCAAPAYHRKLQNTSPGNQMKNLSVAHQIIE